MELPATLPGPRADLAWYSRLLPVVCEAVPLAVAVLAAPGFEVLLANRRFDELLSGLSPSPRLTGRRMADIVPPTHRPLVAALLEAVVASGEAVSHEDLPCARPGREGTHWRLSASPVRNEAGAIAALVVTALETTEEVDTRLQAAGLSNRLQAANEQLSLANLRLQTIIGQLPQGVVAIDAEARVVLANHAAERLLGVALTPGAPYYVPDVDRLKPDGSLYEIADLPMPRSLRGETCYGVEIQVHRPNGQVTSTLCSSAPVRDSSGQIVAAVSVFQDITELRALDRLKDEFLSVASHELKNPLTVLSGYVQVLLAGPVGERSEREQRILRAISRETYRLTRLMNVVLDVSRIQLGQMRLDRQRVDLVSLAHHLAERFHGVSARHRVVCETALTAAEGLWDPVRIEQVLANLIDNAVKYSPEGGDVAIGVRADGESVVVSVRDEGVGVPREEQDHIFERFYRAPALPGGQIAGMGLGLYVSREIIRAHGGRLWLTSEPGQGSEFSFSLPWRKAEQ